MNEKVTISLKEGKIRGIKQLSKFSNTEFYSFFGIPYGKPPINSLRFRDPVKATPWKGVFDATKEKEGCIQFSLLTMEFLGSEDCLFNNIHIPKLPQKNDILKPVIVNLYMGAYNFGSPQQKIYGSPEFIMHNDVVYVGISYRLHILGFLNLALKECSGNQGIKDVLLSLKWIKDNIRSFGGDPQNVTLLGCSSGAVFIHSLMLSPSAKGLFHKAVMMGLYLQAPTSFMQETNENHATEIAKILGYNGNIEDHKNILLFLKKQNPLLLIESCRQCQNNVQQTIAPIYPTSVFCPSLDGGDILPEIPEKLINSMARIPVMIGVSQIESVLGFVRRTRPSTEKYFKYSLRQNCFGWGYHLSDDEVDLIDKEVQEFYYKEQLFEEIPLRLKMDIQTDVSISDVYDTVINPIAADLPSSVFVYKFEYDGDIPTINRALKDMFNEPIKGTYHGIDFCYWNCFGDPRDKRTRYMVETFTKLIANFARTGDPNYENLPVKWRPTTLDEPCYLSFDDPLVMVDGKLNNDRLEFWDGIKKKYTSK